MGCTPRHLVLRQTFTARTAGRVLASEGGGAGREGGVTGDQQGC
jgi:hypothetical protein